MQRSAAFYGTLLLTTLTLTRASLAAPFPKRGYIIDKTNNGYRRLAYLGFRSSKDAGQRAAMRMLARLMRWYPRREVYSVEWETLDAKGKKHLGWALFIDGDTDQSIQIEGAVYGPVTRRMIRRAARHNGSFRSLTRYGAVDRVNTIDINLGWRASYDAGSQATMRTLARHLQSPFDAVYHIVWRYPRTSEKIVKIEVNYNPVIENGTLFVTNNGNQCLGLYTSASKRRVRALGRRSGSFDDLPKRGAK